MKVFTLALSVALCALFTQACSREASEQTEAPKAPEKVGKADPKTVDNSAGKVKAPADTVKAPADKVKAPADTVKAPADKVKAPADKVKSLTDFEKSFKDSLVRPNGDKSALVSAELKPADYYLVYYSAHWCPPCRTFTPKLVQAYNALKTKNLSKSFELVFVSYDKNEGKQLQYIKEDKMPWLSLKYGKQREKSPITSYAARGIPNLVLVDNTGKAISISYPQGQRPRGPHEVLKDFADMIQQ